ncbi:unnamed protein product [Bursaphelenchus okinawaensis]|uniref:Potassium channel domain-containing protein n=1 Tax=Bursaphelenchus okinawaensis TaxID=465554 RepID=A0A811LLG5_9BILA|nr:unnamed protein product [Bursaphelenchus okinawaensis]CAG9126355.1 unnamed protein product [Bursaphelenchus okinawaensis]
MTSWLGLQDEVGIGERKPSKSSLRPSSALSYQADDRLSQRHVAFVEPKGEVPEDHTDAQNDKNSNWLPCSNVSLGTDPQSGRIKSMKLIDESLAEHIFHLSPSSGGLFPTISLDRRTVHRNILNQQKPTVFQHMAKFHHKMGIRHLLLVGVLILYAVLGGLLFLIIEKDAEYNSVRNNLDQLNNITDDMTDTLYAIFHVDRSNRNFTERIKLCIRDYYQRMLKVEGKLIGSAFQYDNLEPKLSWNYGSAVFYSMTLFTSIGYGSIACKTDAGKILTVVYSVLGIPLMLMVLSDVGQVILKWLTIAYNGARKMYYKLNTSKSELPYYSNNSLDSWDSDDSIEPKSFPMHLAIPIIIVYMLLCALVISILDQNAQESPGISFWDAFYYTFISISTIGLGDVLPYNIEHSSLLALMFLFGLALLSVVNSTVYTRLQKRFLAAINMLESWLETLHYHRHGREGYMVFKALGPNLQLLALALPLFDNEDKIERMLGPENTDLGKKLFRRPQRPSRSRSLLEQDMNKFKPTLGIFNMVPSKPRRNRSSTFAGNINLTDLPQSECDSRHQKQIKRSNSEHVTKNVRQLKPRTKSEFLRR